MDKNDEARTIVRKFEKISRKIVLVKKILFQRTFQSHRRVEIHFH